MIEINNPLNLQTPVASDDVQNWLLRCIPPRVDIQQIQIIILDDESLLKMNQRHLEHDYYTDILTFDYAELKTEIDCELYISLERVEDNAQQLRETFEREYLRVIAHGILHLLGFNDKTNEEEALMRNEEDRWLLLYDSPNVSRETP